MIRRLTSQLPVWARPNHPFLRYELSRNGPLPARARYLRALAVVLAGLLLLGIGYLIATGMLQHPPGQDLTKGAFFAVRYASFIFISRRFFFFCSTARASGS